MVLPDAADWVPALLEAKARAGCPYLRQQHLHAGCLVTAPSLTAWGQRTLAYLSFAFCSEALDTLEVVAVPELVRQPSMREEEATLARLDLQASVAVANRGDLEGLESPKRQEGHRTLVAAEEALAKWVVAKQAMWWPRDWDHPYRKLEGLAMLHNPTQEIALTSARFPA